MNVFQMSIAAAVLIIIIIVVRQLAIHKLPKKTFMILWCVVLLRLLIPFSVNLPSPTQPSVETITSVEAITSNTVDSVVEIGSVTNTDFVPITLPRTDILEAVNTFNAMLPNISENSTPFIPLTAIWVFGMLAVALFVLVTHMRFRREYSASLPVDNYYINKWLDEQKGLRHIQIRQSDRITAPLTYGILKPVILFPKTTEWKNIVRLRYILTHELTHIRRFDIVAKWLLVITLCIHWFNPLVWAMYILANRDIELSCDEAVIKVMGESTKSSYAMALIGLEERRSIFAPLCTSFSKNLIDERIVSIMKIKKRSIMSIILATVLVTALTIGALTVFASSTPEERLYDPYDERCESLRLEPIPVATEDMRLEAILADDEDYSVVDDENLTSYESLDEWQSPYRIARTLEDVRAIIALQDGTIPLTDVDVPEIRNRQADGIIILEQCLYEALDVLHQAYFQSYPHYPIRNMTTTRVDMAPSFDEMPDFHKVIMLSNEFFRAAMDMGLVYMPPGAGRYGTDDEIDRNREEARRLLELYEWEFPSEESIREAAILLYGCHEAVETVISIPNNEQIPNRLIPLSDFEQLGFDVEWHPNMSMGMGILRRGNLEIIAINRGYGVAVNYRNRSMTFSSAIAPKILDGVLMLPYNLVDDILEALDLQ